MGLDGAFASTLVWDTETFQAISARHVQLVRDAGSVAHLPLHLWQLASPSMWTGDFAGAASLAAESESVAEATGSRIPPYTLLRLRALQGPGGRVLGLAGDSTKHAAVRGTGIITSRHWGAAVLCNGLGRYEEAVPRQPQAASDTVTRRPSMWALPELVEAAARSGDTELARDASSGSRTTQPCDTDFASASKRVAGRCSATARRPRLYREAIDRLSRPGCVRTPAPTCSTASGCAAKAAGSTPRAAAHAHDMFTRSAWRHSPSAPAGS